MDNTSKQIHRGMLRTTDAQRKHFPRIRGRFVVVILVLSSLVFMAHKCNGIKEITKQENQK